MFNIYLAPPRALEPQGVSAFIGYKMCTHKNKIYLVFFRKIWYYKDMKGICLYGSRSS